MRRGRRVFFKDLCPVTQDQFSLWESFELESAALRQHRSQAIRKPKVEVTVFYDSSHNCCTGEPVALEGIVANIKNGPYVSEPEHSTRQNIVNLNYSAREMAGTNCSSVKGTRKQYCNGISFALACAEKETTTWRNWSRIDTPFCTIPATETQVTLGAEAIQTKK